VEILDPHRAAHELHAPLLVEVLDAIPAVG